MPVRKAKPPENPGELVAVEVDPNPIHTALVNEFGDPLVIQEEKA